MVLFQRKKAINIIIISIIIFLAAAFTLVWIFRQPILKSVNAALYNLHIKKEASVKSNSTVSELSEEEKFEIYETNLLNGFKTNAPISFSNLRAVKVLAGRDFLTSEKANTEQQQKEINEIIDYALNLNMNAVIVDISPYLQKKAAGLGMDFDYLQYFESQAQTKGLVIIGSVDPLKLNPSYTYQNNYTVKLSDNSVYFNPGLPEVREYISKAIPEIIKSSRMTALIIDNPSYPSKDINDTDTYNKYGTSLSIDNFRRKCINLLLYGIVSNIKDENPTLSVGTGVYGIWSVSPPMDKGTAVKATATGFADKYQDSYEWIKSNRIDFVVPEIEWSTVNKDMPFDKIAQWWLDTVKDTNVSLVISHSVYKLGSKETGFSNIPEISIQYDTVQKLTGCSGSIFNGYKALKANPTAITGLKLLFKNSLDFTTLFNNLAITEPKNNITTDRESVTVRGVCDNNFPIYYNNKEIKPTAKGQFAFDVPLSPGKNVIKINHKDSTRSVTVNYKVTVLKQVPTGNISENGSTSIAISVNAHVGATITGIFNKTKYTFQAVSGGNDGDAQQNTEFINYVTIINLPKGTTNDQNLGPVTISGSYKGFKETKKTGNIIVKALPKIEIPSTNPVYDDNPNSEPRLIAEANEIFTQTYDEKTPGYSTPTNHFLPKGTKDYVVGKMTDMNKATMLYLKSGQKVYEKDCKLTTITNSIPSNNITDADIKYTNKYTEITFKGAKNALYKGKFNNTYEYNAKNNYNTDFVTDIFDFTIFNTVKAPNISEFNSPLFSSVQMADLGSNTYKYTFKFKNTGKFYGFRVYYNGDGDMVLRFTNPLKISSDPSKPLSGFKILIDPGHGGANSGADAYIGKTLYMEKNLNLSVSLKLRDRLVSLGAEVGMTRTGDTTVTLDERLYKGWTYDPDVYLSIHHNSSESSSPRGVLSFYYYGFSTSLTNAIESKLSAALYGTNKYASGYRYQEFRPLKNHSTLGVLIECGFMSNPFELENLLKPEYQDKEAQAICDGLVAYFS